MQLAYYVLTCIFNTLLTVPCPHFRLLDIFLAAQLHTHS